MPCFRLQSRRQSAYELQLDIDPDAGTFVLTVSRYQHQTALPGTLRTREKDGALLLWLNRPLGVVHLDRYFECDALKVHRLPFPNQCWHKNDWYPSTDPAQ